MAMDLGEAWSHASAGYDNYFVPRFAPWVASLMEVFKEAEELPPGPVASPCCGTGAELEQFARHFPTRDLFGVNLSGGMIQNGR